MLWVFYFVCCVCVCCVWCESCVWCVFCRFCVLCVVGIQLGNSTSAFRTLPTLRMRQTPKFHVKTSGRGPNNGVLGGRRNKQSDILAPTIRGPPLGAPSFGPLLVQVLSPPLLEAHPSEPPPFWASTLCRQTHLPRTTFSHAQLLRSLLRSLVVRVYSHTLTSMNLHGSRL